jgi:hypothetical protein
MKLFFTHLSFVQVLANFRCKIDLLLFFDTQVQSLSTFDTIKLGNCSTFTFNVLQDSFHARNRNQLEEIESSSTSKTVPEASASQPQLQSIIIDRCAGENGNEFLVTSRNGRPPKKTPSDLVRAFNSRSRSQRVSSRRLARNL